MVKLDGEAFWALALPLDAPRVTSADSATRYARVTKHGHLYHTTMTLAGLSLSYHAARHGAGLILRDHGRILVAGKDRASYLQGLLTNDIEALTPGVGCYAAYLTAQGRMITDLWVYELGDVILLALPRAVTDAVLAKLDQFIFSEDVQLGDVTDTLAAVAVVGPDAARVAAHVLGVDQDTLATLPEHGALRCTVHGEPMIVLGDSHW